LVKDDTELGATLTVLLKPDVVLSPANPDIGFIHRRTADAEIYFLANTSNTRQVVQANIRVQGLLPEWWDPISGAVTPAYVIAGPDDATTLPLVLFEPYGSRVLVFSKRSQSGVRSNGISAAHLERYDLSSDWRVSFGQSGTATQMDKLRSWTDNEATRYFSGTATYEKDVVLPKYLWNETQTVRLDFGEGQALPVQQSRSGMQTWFEGPIREAAVVYINDQRAGSIWCPPYSLDVTGLVRSGKNKIRIVVANTALNYMAGHSLPDYRLLNLRYGERFQAQDMDKVQALPSGLLGPIRLIATTR
jgi:alpha-L-rhamnosidase